MHVALIGSIRFPTAALADLDAPLRVMVEATRREEGCLFYSLAPDPTDPGRVTVAEVFRDADALAAHRASEHMAVWREVCAKLGLHDRQMTTYDVASSAPH